MNRLEDASELLDGPLDDPDTLRGNLRDLGRANRWLGGVTLSQRAIDALIPGDEPLSLVDVGTGGADIPRALLDAAARRHRLLTVTAVDSRPEVIEAARELGAAGQAPGLVLTVADGRSLRFEDGSFDVAHASLVLHHLDPADVPAFLRELARVARRGIVVNDLARSRLTLFGAWLLSRLFTRNRYSRVDAPLSARRAYTTAEVMPLLAAADLRPVVEVTDVFRHRWAIAAVRR